MKKVQGNWIVIQPSKRCSMVTMLGPIQGKLYKKEILLPYPYPEGMIYEDLAIAYEHIVFDEEIAMNDLNLYKYYRRAGSIVNSKYSDRLWIFTRLWNGTRAHVDETILMQDRK